MRWLCLLLTCTFLCGCFMENVEKFSEKWPEKPAAVVQVQVKTKPTEIQAPETAVLKDPQPKNNVGWPVTIIICSLFLFMPLLAHRRLK